jgi:RimJ/RimL family protein N-acetyltransferase
MGAREPWNDALVTFRRLEASDAPLMHRWLNSPHVTDWYIDEPTELEEIAAKYAPGAPDEPDERYLIRYDGRPIGYVQTYPLVDYPDYAIHVAEPEEVAAGAHGMDLFIGEAEFQHRGLGPLLMRRFLREIVFGRLGAPVCFLDPEPDNRAAIRAYEKTGFRHVKTVQIPGQRVASYVMRIAPEDLDAVQKRESATVSTPRPLSRRTARRMTSEAATRTTERRRAVPRSPAS